MPMTGHRRSEPGGTDKNSNSNKSPGEAEHDQWRWARPGTAQPIEQSNVNRNGRDEERCEAGRNPLFGDGDSAVAKEQETSADDKGTSPFRETGFGRALPAG